jgi:DUF4097 and DUF4098 domain-containing protein YvlB
MRKILKRFTLIGLLLTLLGGVIFLVGFAMSGFDIHKMGNIQIEEKQYSESAENPITSISLDFNLADFEILFDDDAESIFIEYPQRQTKKGKNLSKITLTETENSVTITETNNKFFLSAFNFVSPVVRVTLPASRTYDLSVESNTGDITILGNGTLSSLFLETSTGDTSTKRANLTCLGECEIETNTGDVYLGNFEADNLSISTDTGDIELFGRLKANLLDIEVDTGDIEADDGVIDAVHIVLSADTGDIEATLLGNPSDYAIAADTDTGDSNISSSLGSSPTRWLEVETDTGDIDITFIAYNAENN